MTACVFCKIASGDIPAKKLYEDDEMLAFHDIAPVAEVHFLLIPKKHLISLAHAAPEDERLLGKLLLKGQELAAQEGLLAGFKTQINTGKGGGQEVFHLHVHIFGQRGEAVHF